MPTFTIQNLSVVSLRAGNLPATAHFYRDVLGLELRHHDGHRPHFQIGAVILVLSPGQPQPLEEAERFPSLAFAVDDLDSAVARLRAHGVALPWGVETNGRDRWVMFYDPAGNLIELVAWGENLQSAP